MKTIWKFPLAIADRQRIMMPQGAEILTAQRQGDQACVWAIVNDAAPMKPRLIEIAGTGNRLAELDEEYSRKYIGTFQFEPFVWHVFEIV